MPKERKTSRAIFTPANTREVSGLSNVLSKEFLMKTCYVDIPEHLNMASISGYNLVHHNSKSLHEFTNLVSIDASDNQLTLEAFEEFPSLESLDLSVNIITDLISGTGAFARLQTLNLSYNNMTADALVFLGSLPALTTLYLTGNNLVSLPPTMVTPFIKEGSDKVLMRYPELRTLWLDDNKLCDPSVFAVLAGLRELEHLILSDNELKGIPQLKLLSTDPPKAAPDQPSHCGTSLINHVSTPFVAVSSSRSSREKPHPPTQGVKSTRHVKFPSGTRAPSSPGLSSYLGKHPSMSPFDQEYGSPPRSYRSPQARLPSIEKSGEQASYLRHSKERCLRPVPSSPNSQFSSNCVTPRKSEPINNKVEKLRLPVPASPSQDDRSEGVREKVEPSLECDITEQDLDEFSPFPKLKVLNLTNNLVSDADDVLCCEWWPALTQVILTNNPLVRSYKGLHPVLKEALVHRRGIQVIRQASKPEKHTTHIREKVKLLKKISSSPPPAVPKYPLLPAIEATPTASPPIQRSQSNKLSPGLSDADYNDTTGYYGYSQQGSLGSESEATSSVDSLGVFMTQVASHEESEEPKKINAEDDRSKQEETAVAEDEVWSPVQAYQDRLRALEERFKDAGERYKGYEVLLDDGGVTGEPGCSIPTDMLGCCKSLQHLLRRPLLLPRYTCHTLPVYKAAPPTDKSQVHKKRPVEMRSSCVPRQGEVLGEMKNQSVDLETDVGSVLASRSSSRTAKQLRKECKRLLTEMQRHYDDVKANTLK